MNFSEINFWFILLSGLFVIRILSMLPWNIRGGHRMLLLSLSLLLLGLASWETLLIFLFVALSAYGACLYGRRLCLSGRKWLLACMIPVILSPLFFYKYAYFFSTQLFAVPPNGMRELVIPIGISFYSFQVIGFCVDTLMRHEPLPSLLNYLNFCSFFPQIVAGPIERRKDLLPQIRSVALVFHARNVNVGIRYIVLGLFFKMVMADNLACALIPNYQGQCAWMLWTQNLIFTFRIYFDFAGYSLTAYGLARCLGITLRFNFLSPYTATNIREFWRRWHTSLMQWFRDYIYLPSGGSRTRFWMLNILMVFTVSGLWHGAGWNFVLWGVLCGIAMVLYRLVQHTDISLPPFLGWVLTFSLMIFLWMFFYDSHAEALSRHLQLLITPEAYSLTEWIRELKGLHGQGLLTLLFVPLSFLIIYIEHLSRRTKGRPYALFLSAPACSILVFGLITLEANEGGMFMYFSF
ncbi:MAG: MBOAT family O-acyltransferase [Akkermansia sp.]